MADAATGREEYGAEPPSSPLPRRRRGHAGHGSRWGNVQWALLSSSVICFSVVNIVRKSSAVTVWKVRETLPSDSSSTYRVPFTNEEEDEFVARYNVTLVGKDRRFDVRRPNVAGYGTEPGLPRPYPHAGARDENGTYDNVLPDPGAIRTLMQSDFAEHYNSATIRRPPLALYMPAHWSAATLMPTLCNRSINIPDTATMQGYRKLLRPNEYDYPTDGTRVLCGIYTYEKNHHRIPGIMETWGWHCDGIWVASNKTVREYNAVDLTHAGPESYYNMWQKTRAMLAYAHDHFINDYDYFYFCGDDTHVIVESLKHYLAAMNRQYPRQPLVLGHEVVVMHNVTFLGGGPGYALNRLAVKLFVRRILPHCFAALKAPEEDMALSRCLEWSAGLRVIDSADQDGAQRFHGFPMYAVTRNETWWLHQAFRDHWARTHGVKTTGVELVSPTSVAFHVKHSTNAMRLHHALVYRTCPADTVLGQIQW